MHKVRLRELLVLQLRVGFGERAAAPVAAPPHAARPRNAHLRAATLVQLRVVPHRADPDIVRQARGDVVEGVALSAVELEREVAAELRAEVLVRAEEERVGARVRCVREKREDSSYITPNASRARRP